MDQILVHKVQKSGGITSKTSRLEYKNIAVFSVAGFSKSCNSISESCKKNQAEIEDFLGKLDASKKNERDKLAKKVILGGNENISGRNSSRENYLNQTQAISVPRMGAADIETFFKVKKRTENSLKVHKNITEESSKKNNRKRNWDSSSEDENPNTTFSPERRKRIKQTMSKGKENGNGDIKEMFENLRKSYFIKKGLTYDDVELSKSNKLENRSNSNTDPKDLLRKCQSVESVPCNKIQNQFNSMPFTTNEYKSAKRRVEDEKLSFNEFITKFFKNLDDKNILETNTKKDEDCKSSKLNEVPTRNSTVEKPILEIIESLKQNKKNSHSEFCSKERQSVAEKCLRDSSVPQIDPLKVRVEPCDDRKHNSVNTQRQYLMKDYLPREGNRIPLLTPKTLLRQCSGNIHPSANDLKRTEGQLTIDDMLEMLRREKHSRDRKTLMEVSKNDNSVEKCIRVDSILASLQPRSHNTQEASYIDSQCDILMSSSKSKITNNKLSGLFNANVNNIHNRNDYLDISQQSSSNCESKSEESIDFAMYLSADYNTDAKPRTPQRNLNVSGGKLNCEKTNISTLKENSFSNGEKLPLVYVASESSERAFKMPSVKFLKDVLGGEGSKSYDEKYDGNNTVVEQRERSSFNTAVDDTIIIHSSSSESCEKTLFGATQNSTIIDSSAKDNKTVVESKNCDSLLDDDEINTILTENYEKFRRRKQMEIEKCGSELNVFLEKLAQQTAKEPKKFYSKRYRKGRLRIYRLKKLKKVQQPANTINENMNLKELLKKMTQDFVEPSQPFVRSKSVSSVSTSSSYVTDDARSETLSTGSTELAVPQQRLRKGLNEILKDKSLYCEESQMFHKEYDKDEIKKKIQSIFLNVFEDLTNGGKASLELRRQTLTNCVFKNGRLQFKPNDEIAMSVIKSNVQRSRAKFKLILCILKKIQTLLETNTKLTKRELYYQLKSLIGDQRVTDRAINAISCLLDVGMWALNIVAQKGLVFGNLKILLASGEILNCNVPGTLIPQDVNEIIELHSSAYFILVIEKESIFHKLIEENLPNKLTRPFIMITGKGFPDLNTQLFLRRLWVAMSIPVFILVDADPDGISIMLNYRFGSVNAHVSHHLAVPKAKWLGVFPSELRNFSNNIQPLSEREVKLAEDLLKTPYMAENPEIVRELKVLIEKKRKAGIEGLIKSNVFLSEVYFPAKFFSHDFI
nr:uncharacterized protein LOC111508828 isoform X2 [Leptinotarsa decemlineata]